MAENPTLDFGPLADSTGFLLRLAQIDAFERYFDATSGEAGPPLDMVLLTMIARNPGIRQGVLARALRIKRAHMTKIVRLLEDADLLSGRVPDDDRRAIELSLTPAGRTRLAAIWDRIAPHERALPPGLSAPEADTLRDLLRKLVALDRDAP